MFISALFFVSVLASPAARVRQASVPDAVGLVNIADLLKFYVGKNPTALWSFPVFKTSLIECAQSLNINWSGLDHHTWAELLTKQFRFACSHVLLLRRDPVKRNRRLEASRATCAQTLLTTRAHQ